MRSIAILLMMSLVLVHIAVLGLLARTEQSAEAEVKASTGPVPSWICAKAFYDTLVGEATTQDETRLDQAVGTCSSLDDWLLAATMYPDVLGDTDPTGFLETRCHDESVRAQGHVTCDSLGIEPIERMPGRLRIRSGRSGTSSLPDGVGMEIILDTSGSMLREQAGSRQIDVAKDSLSLLVRDALAPGLPLALRSFGGDADSGRAVCGSTLTAALAPLEPETMLGVVASVAARKRTKSPIAASIAAVADDLRSATRSRIVVLVTDGDENCGGDPIREIETLRGSGVPLTLNVVGFALEHDSLRDTMLAWTRAGSGRYFDAVNADELATAITEAATFILDAPITISGPGGIQVHGATVDGEAVELDPGVYHVMVEADPPVIFEAVEIVSGGSIELFLDRPA
jgi:hypothetical protein